MDSLEDRKESYIKAYDELIDVVKNTLSLVIPCYKCKYKRPSKEQCENHCEFKINRQ